MNLECASTIEGFLADKADFLAVLCLMGSHVEVQFGGIVEMTVAHRAAQVMPTENHWVDTARRRQIRCRITRGNSCASTNAASAAAGAIWRSAVLALHTKVLAERPAANIER